MRTLLISALVLGQAGCTGLSAGRRELPALPRPVGPTAALARPVPIVQVAFTPPEPGTDAALTLAALTTVAERNHPDLAAARARAEAARGRLVQAGLYPNPTIGWEASELGHNVRQIGEQGPRFSQNIVTGGKLRLDQAAAAQALAAAEWQALTQWYAVLTRLRAAFFEVLTAEREVQTNEELVRLTEEGLNVAKQLLEAKIGTRPDVIRAQVELDLGRTRLSVARQRLTAARQLLTTATGVAALPTDTVRGSLEEAVPEFAWEPALQTVLSRSSEMLEAQANVLQAEQLVQRAYAQNVPDLMLMARPFYVYPNQDMRATVQVGVVVPLFNRNQGNIAAAQADLTRSREEVRQVELRLTERLTGAFQRYRNARLQAEAYRKQILPNARESLQLVRLGYKAGDPKYEYTAVLQAQQTLVQAQLTYVQALGELWRAASEIAGLIQQDEL